jgi:hypothetical protein
MTAAPRPRLGAATYRKEGAIRVGLERGLTYAAIAVAAGVTRRVVRYTAERLGIRRAPGRPRATAPSLIPSRSSPPSRW